MILKKARVSFKYFKLAEKMKNKVLDQSFFPLTSNAAQFTPNIVFISNLT